MNRLEQNVILNKLPVQTTELLLRRSTEGLGGVGLFIKAFCLAFVINKGDKYEK